MILSILETSLPRQRSHDTLASGIWAKNWCAKRNRYNWLHLNLPPNILNVMKMIRLCCKNNLLTTLKVCICGTWGAAFIKVLNSSSNAFTTRIKRIIIIRRIFDIWMLTFCYLFVAAKFSCMENLLKNPPCSRVTTSFSTRAFPFSMALRRSIRATFTALSGLCFTAYWNLAWPSWSWLKYFS